MPDRGQRRPGGRGRDAGDRRLLPGTAFCLPGQRDDAGCDTREHRGAYTDIRDVHARAGGSCRIRLCPLRGIRAPERRYQAGVARRRGDRLRWGRDTGCNEPRPRPGDRRPDVRSPEDEPDPRGDRADRGERGQGSRS